MPVTADRIHRSIADIQGRIDGLDDPAKLARLTENALLDLADWVTMGPMASEMTLFGLIDLDAAMLLHRIHTDYNNGDSTLAERMVFLQVMSEFLACRGRLIEANSR